MIGIYKITNQINGKCYIGQSVNITRRWKDHRTRYQTEDNLLYRAIRKYGLENFSFEIIEECSQEKLNEREIYWIAFYNSANSDKGYNLTTGGNNTANHKLTEEQILEIYSLLKQGVNQIDIANKYDIAQPMVSMINSGIYYTHQNVSYPISTIGLKKEWHCELCGTPTSKGLTRCPVCAAKARRKVSERPSREELKNLIRTTPFTKIGEIFGVTDNAIRKWCDAVNLPRKSTEIKKYSDEEWKKI